VTLSGKVLPLNLTPEQQEQAALANQLGYEYTPPPDPTGGPVERALKADLQALAESGALFSATLAATATALARALDEGPSNTTAGIAKELRATLDKLAEGATDDRAPDFSGLSTPDDGGSGPDVPAAVGDPAPF
jgi:hypothetical protein